MANNAFARVTYTEAVAICAKVSGPKAGVAWEYTPAWGEELQTEHEKYAPRRPRSSTHPMHAHAHAHARAMRILSCAWHARGTRAGTSARRQADRQNGKPSTVNCI